MIASSFLVLCLFFVQVAIARVLEPGKYFIQDNRGNYLGIGPVPPIYPPIDVPARLVPNHIAEKWIVDLADNGAFTISAGRGRHDDYKLVSREDVVYVSARMAPEPWTMTSAGDGKFMIQAPNRDLVYTANVDEFPHVTLQPASGEDSQRWTFVRIDRDNYWRGYRNRFCVQEEW
ncbi:hypothetical protein BGZ54_001629 [Gamsiella multidivaricata]|nr:hypothetical protein BGZ54_001629 [Gamsiella multidivaricata]